MKITISFRHLEHTPSLDDRIHEKTEKLAKYLDGKTHVKWSCYVKEGNHYAEVDLIGPHFEHHAHGHTDSLYKTIDVVVAKLEKQLHKQKDKWKDRRRHQNAGDPVMMEPEVAWGDYDEDNFEDVG